LQNLLPGGLRPPQEEHITSRRFPQELQKRAWSGLGALQPGQFIGSIRSVYLTSVEKGQSKKGKDRLQGGKESLAAYCMGNFRLHPDIRRSRKLDAMWSDLPGWRWIYSRKEVPLALKVVKEKNGCWKWALI